MDDNTSCSPPITSQDQISFLFGHLSPSSSPCAVAASASSEGSQMPYSSYYPSPGGIERGNGEDSGAGSEEGVEVPEEPAKSVPRRTSGSKRSRAAEVHNLSEKRRRSRINEKMKALQNLIPNSNKKTDKASMLDEAIEYLKQLQLQVQMLSMRNGLNVHPMYLPGTLQSLQASQLCMGFGVDNTSAMNMGVGMLPLNQEPSAHNSFDVSSQCTSSHQPIILPTTVANISGPGTSFGMETSESHHRSFQLGVPSAEMFTEDMVPQQQLDSGRTTRNLSENEMKNMAVATSSHFGGQPSSSLEHNDRLEDVLPKDHPDNNQIFIQHLDGLQTGRSFATGDVKTESLEF